MLSIAIVDIFDTKIVSNKGEINVAGVVGEEVLVCVLGLVVTMLG
jgi:hypothetical protein